MMLRAAGAIYGAAALARRRWYAARPARRRRLKRPVISVGNLRVGGTGKTPVTAHLARTLLRRGERPAILSRGYGRQQHLPGVTVVSDRTHVLAGLEAAGDEPLMLARSCPGVPVLVADRRYDAGLLAEQRFDVTVHLLDDGFQHLALARDLDLLLLSDEDLHDRPLPAGRLREPLAAAAAADVILVTGDGDALARVSRATGVTQVYRLARHSGPARWADAARPGAPPARARVFAMAAVARPERFFRDATAAGFDVRGAMAFRDHHHFSDVDLARIHRESQAAGADLILTTEKDAVRFVTRLDGIPPLAVLPLVVEIDPPSFDDWFTGRLQAARQRRSA